MPLIVRLQTELQLLQMRPAPCFRLQTFDSKLPLQRVLSQAGETAVQ